MTICVTKKQLPMFMQDPLIDSFEKKATRDGYGDGLLEAAEMFANMVVLDADLSGSTKTKSFSKKYPQRFFNFGVAEQNLTGNAAGMALSGLIPVVSSFAMFLSGRAWEIVRNSIAYPSLNVKLSATHSGLTLGEDGASHQTIEDIAIMRTIPGMTVVVPADYQQAKQAIIAALHYQGPVYIRNGRPAVPVLYSQEHSFVIGKGHLLQQGEEVAFIATGIMVFEAWKAAKLLEKNGWKKITVINMATIKPLDIELLKSVVNSHKKIFTFEEHNVIGGLGSAVAEFVCGFRPILVERIGVNDVFGQSGTPQELLEHYGLTAHKIVERLSM